MSVQVFVFFTFGILAELLLLAIKREEKALKLYQKCIAKPDSSLAARCCNFKMLEEKCSSYSDT